METLKENNLSEVLSLARKIRNCFERLAERANNDLDLGGYCWRASVQLHLAAKEKGIDVGILASDQHVFNIYNGHLIDITATQFGKTKKVWVVKANKKVLKREWLPRTLTPGEDPVCRNVKELFSKTGWWTPRDRIYRDKRFVQKYLESECQK
jgi:hypothetical protein